MANTYDKGDLVRITVELRNTANVLVAPGAITASLKDPSAVTTNPALTNDAVGQYHFDVNANQAGTWYYRVASTGANQGAAEDSFIVTAGAF